MLNNFNQKIIDSILELIKQEDDCLFKSFVKQFYSFSYDSDITLDTNFFLFITRDLY
ncbi:NAD-glutamate dehydrogenase family protein, truncation [Ehrlichia chaffeensis str. Arkansas]|uniref:NAD-glutamate dehydrogenase family protein, truncation n=1 Tax=Ehrlichia chaffeensis (strain ATCC CRL-10679 / Arkansas) TaxID=205920 RepID=Q2GG76_EHRCR